MVGRCPFSLSPCRPLFYLFVLESLNISQCVHVCVNVYEGVHSHHVCGGQRIIPGASHLSCVSQGLLFFASVQEASWSKASRIPAVSTFSLPVSVLGMTRGVLAYADSGNDARVVNSSPTKPSSYTALILLDQWAFSFLSVCSCNATHFSFRY